jgi:hypothetical protein
MQKIQIIGFFFENRLHWQCEVKKIFTNGYFRLYIYLYSNTTLFGWWLSTVTSDENFGNSLSNLGTPLAFTIHSIYLRLKLLTTPDLKF